MKRAFTLIEMLMAVAIVAVLAALIIPSLEIAQARAQASQCIGNLRQLGIALNLYLGDNQMILPSLVAARKSRDEPVPAIDNTLDRYVPDPRVFKCPADPGVALKTGTSYYWDSALQGQLATNLNLLNLATDVSKIPVMLDKEGWHKFQNNKVNFLYADGHVTQEFHLTAQ